MVKIISNFGILMKLAKKVGETELAFKADPTNQKLLNEYNEACEKHENYRQICLKSDEMGIGISKGNLGK